MISAIKKDYFRHFRAEDRSILGLVRYRLILAGASLAYKFKYRSVLERTGNFVDAKLPEVRQQKKSAFVFANGPSLSEIDLNKVGKLCETGQFDLIAINSFLSKSGHLVKPTYAVFADNVHFAGGDTQYTKDIKACEDLGVTYFVPAKYAQASNYLQYGYCSLCDIDSDNVSDILRPAGYYGVTAFFAISLASTLGYDKIYICGFDNSYFRDFGVDHSGELYINHRHYYDGNESDTRVPTTYSSSSGFFFDVYRHFYYLEKIAKGNGSIRNLAHSSYLSSIPRHFDLDIYK